MKLLNLLVAGACLLAGAAQAQLTVAIGRPWLRATVPQQRTTGGYVQLTPAADARLVEAQSPVAGRVEIHTMEMSDNVMKMREAAGIELPAGRMVELKPGGAHLMLLDLKRPLKPGEKVPVILFIEGKDKARTNLSINMPVKELTTTQ
jgi:copper(I)-binding protein